MHKMAERYRTNERRYQQPELITQSHYMVAFRSSHYNFKWYNMGYIHARRALYMQKIKM